MAASRLLIADDHPLVRSGVRRLLEKAGFQVVAEVADGEEAVRVTLAERPDIALLDRVMPKLGGIQAARRITTEAPEVRVVIISGHVGCEPIAEAGRAGASGFVAKTASLEHVLAVVSAVRDGRAFVALDRMATTIDRGDRRVLATERIGMELLTPREQEVLRLVAAGYSSLNVAMVLRLSQRTVETHRLHIMAKLGIHSVAGLTRFALESEDL